MKVLHKRYIFSKKHFILIDDKVLVKEKSAFQDQEYEARYNQIGLDLIKYRNREGIGNVVFFGSLMLVPHLRNSPTVNLSL